MERNVFEKSLPSYIKYFYIIASIILTFFVLIFIQAIFKPLLAAFIVAMLLKPLADKLEKLKIPRSLSSILAITVMFVFFMIFSLFIVFQIKYISSDFNTLAFSFNVAADKIQQWTDKNLGIAPSQQVIYFKNSLAALLKNSAVFLQNALAATADFLTEFFFFMIALFFFLYYRRFFVTFLFQIFHASSHSSLAKTLNSIGHVVRKYIFGLLLVILTTASLNVLGLLIIGLKHAFFFGTVAGVLTIIPYFGIVIGSLLPFLFAIATTNSVWYPIAVILIFCVVQFLEGNFITPNIVGKQVSLNPFAVLVVLFLSGMLFGLLGIILSLPVLAITKVIFESINSLKPFAYIIGNPPKFPRK